MKRVGDLDSELEINAQGLRCRSFNVRCCVRVCLCERVKHYGMKRRLNEATAESQRVRQRERESRRAFDVRQGELSVQLPLPVY